MSTSTSLRRTKRGTVSSKTSFTSSTTKCRRFYLLTACYGRSFISFESIASLFACASTASSAFYCPCSSKATLNSSPSIVWDSFSSSSHLICCISPSTLLYCCSSSYSSSTSSGPCFTSLVTTLGRSSTCSKDIALSSQLLQPFP